MSTLSTAGYLPLGIVVTSPKSSDVIHKGMNTLKELFPKSAFLIYVNGYPTNITIDGSSANKKVYTKLGQVQKYLCVHSTFSKECGDDLYAVKIIYIKKKDSI